MYKFSVGGNSAWVEDVETARQIGEKLNKAIEIIKHIRQYSYCRITPIFVGEGVHERDTGYMEFKDKYYCYCNGNWTNQLVADFSVQKEELDGTWFFTLNFHRIFTTILTSGGPINLDYSRGCLRIHFNVYEEFDQSFEEDAVKALTEEFGPYITVD